MGDSVVVQGKKSTAELEAYVIMEVAIGEEGGGGWQGSLAANITKVWSGRGEVVVGSKVSKVY